MEGRLEQLRTGLEATRAAADQAREQYHETTRRVFRGYFARLKGSAEELDYHVAGGLEPRDDGKFACDIRVGVGEKSPRIRAEALQGLGFLGIELDVEKNRRAADGTEEVDIAAPGSGVRVLVIPTNEELVIVEDTREIVEGG